MLRDAKRRAEEAAATILQAAARRRAAVAEAGRRRLRERVDAVRRRVAARRIAVAIFRMRHRKVLDVLAALGLSGVSPTVALCAVARVQAAARSRAYWRRRLAVEGWAKSVLRTWARQWAGRRRLRLLGRRVTRVQAIWRSRRVQRTAGRELQLMRAALRKASENAEHKPKIGEATASSLQVRMRARRPAVVHPAHTPRGSSPCAGRAPLPCRCS